VAHRFYELIAPLAVLWSEMRGGSWAPAQTAMLVDMEAEKENEEAAAATAATAATAAADDAAARLRAVLLARGCCIVPVPPALKRVLVAEQCCHSEVTPALVRQLVREAKGVVYQQRRQREDGGRVSSAFAPWPATQEDAQLLLVYCASDLVGEGRKGEVGELDGLSLLPLADGSLGTLAVGGRWPQQQAGGEGKAAAAAAAAAAATYFIVGEAERPLFVQGQHVLGAWA
jgi:hypothetical protein